jgi:hypothetical protein
VEELQTAAASTGSVEVGGLHLHSKHTDLLFPISLIGRADRGELAWILFVGARSNHTPGAWQIEKQVREGQDRKEAAA